MPYPFYKLVHFLGVFLIYASYGGLIFRAALGSDNVKLRKFGAIFGGVGLFLVLLGGFGMMARMGYSYSSGWLMIKVIVWVAFGGLIALINRKPGLSKAWFFTIIILGGLASYAGIYKPGHQVPAPETAITAPSE